MTFRSILPAVCAASLNIAIANSGGVTGPQSETVQPAVPGHALARGMQLVYASQGNESAPWIVDSLDTTARFGEEKRCSFVRFGQRDIRKTCIRGDTLFAWSDSMQTLVATRPLRSGMTMRIPTANGGIAVYETTDSEVVMIGGIAVPTIRTSVTTLNASGKAVRRLRENFAISLGTATGGAFEVFEPDGSWRVTQQFGLVRIIRP